MQKITIDTNYTKSYKTEENLDKALAKLNLPSDLRFVLTEVGGRFTAVFVNAAHVENGVYLSYIAHKGFKVVA